MDKLIFSLCVAVFVAAICYVTPTLFLYAETRGAPIVMKPGTTIEKVYIPDVTYIGSMEPGSVSFPLVSDDWSASIDYAGEEIVCPMTDAQFEGFKSRQPVMVKLKLGYFTGNPVCIGYSP